MSFQPSKRNPSTEGVLSSAGIALPQSTSTVSKTFPFTLYVTVCLFISFIIALDDVFLLSSEFAKSTVTVLSPLIGSRVYSTVFESGTAVYSPSPILYFEYPYASRLSNTFLLVVSLSPLFIFTLA